MSLIFKDGRGRTVPAGARPVKGFDGSIHGYSMPRPSTPRPEEARWKALQDKYLTYTQGRGPALSSAEMAEYQRLSQQLHSSEGGLYWETRNAASDEARARSQQAKSEVQPFRFEKTGGVILRVPNPEYGRQNGFAWDDVNQRWRPRSSEDDIRDQLAQMEMDKRRFDMDRARRDYERERQWAEQDRKRKMAEEDFKRQQEGWAYQELQRRTAEASQPMTPQPSQDSMMDYRKRELADENERFAKQQAARQEAYRKSIGFNPGTQPAKNAYMPVIPPSAAQPVEPQSEGTPYGQQDASAPAQPRRMAPASDYDMFRPRNMLPESGRAGSFLPPEEELAWLEKNLKDREAALAAGNTAAREDIPRLRRVIAELKGRLARGSAPQAEAAQQTSPPKYPVGPDGGRWFGTGLRAKDDPSNPRSPQFQKPILIAPSRPKPPMVY